MSKAFYVFKRLFSHLGGQMIPVWLLVAYATFNLTYVCTIYETHKNIRYYAPDEAQMERWVFYEGTVAFTDDLIRAQREMDALNALPGVERAACQYNVSYIGPRLSGYTVVDAYPSDLLNALGIRDERGERIAVRCTPEDDRFPVWVDSRLKGEVALGAEIPLSLTYGKGAEEPPFSFYVAGYLNRQNAVPRFSGMQLQPTLEDIMDLEGYSYHMVAVADGLERLPGALKRTAQVKALRLSVPAAEGVASLDAAVRKKGMGNCVSYQQILDRYDATETTLSDTNTSTVWFMLPMSVIGLIGVQALLFERLKRLSAVLNLCGMPVKSWLGGWLLLLAALLLVPLLLGFLAFVVLQRLNIVYPLAVGLPARAVFLLPVGGILYAVCFLSVLPTILSILHAKPIELMREAEQ